MLDAQQHFETEAKFLEKLDDERRKNAPLRKCLFPETYDAEQVREMRKARARKQRKIEAQKKATIESVRRAFLED